MFIYTSRYICLNFKKKKIIISSSSSSFESFSGQCELASEWHQVSLNLQDSFFIILADLSNAVVYIVSIRPLISKSSNPCTNPLVTVQSSLHS